MTVQLPSGAVLSVAQREAVVLVNFAGATVLHGAEADGALHRQIEEQAELLKELQAKKAQAAAKGDGHAERLNAEAVAKDMNLLRRPSPSLLRQHTKVRCSLACMCCCGCSPGLTSGGARGQIVRLETHELWTLARARLFAIGVATSRARRFVAARRVAKIAAAGAMVRAIQVRPHDPGVWTQLSHGWLLAALTR